MYHLIYYWKGYVRVSLNIKFSFKKLFALSLEILWDSNKNRGPCRDLLFSRFHNKNFKCQSNKIKIVFGLAQFITKLKMLEKGIHIQIHSMQFYKRG